MRSRSSATWSASRASSRRLAGALAAQGVGREDRVAALCTNSHVMLELHHAVPMLGAALVTLNTRLSADEMAGLLAHSGASVLVATHEFADRARQLAEKSGLPYFLAGGPGDSYEDWIAGTYEAVPETVDESDASLRRSSLANPKRRCLLPVLAPAVRDEAHCCRATR